MKKMTTCKACGKDIAKGVNKCPNCGKDQRNFFMKHKIISVIIIFFIIGTISRLGNSEDKSAETTDSSSSSSQTTEKTATKEQPVSKVGDVIKTDKFEITITSIERKG